MNNYAEHQWQVALFLLFWSACMYLYTRLRPQARREVIRTGALVTFVGSVVFALRYLSFFAPLGETAQTLAYYAGALPYTWAIGYIARVVAANQAKKWPALEWICLKAKPVLFGLVAFSLLLAAFFPAATIYGDHFVSPYPWLDAVYNLSHLLFLTVSALVFGREAVRHQELPSLFMRIQHGALFVGSVLFSLLSANYLLNSLAVTGSLNPALEAIVSDVFLPVELLTLIFGGLAYMIGLFLYDSNEDLERIHAHADLWIEYRAELEIELFYRYGSLIGDSYTDTYCRLLTDPDFGKEHFPESYKVCLSPQARRSTAYMVKLLGLIHDLGDERPHFIYGLRNLHNRLARDNTGISRLIVLMDAGAAYDLNHDALYAAITPALQLASKKTKTDLRDQAHWTQVAAVIAAGASYLPPQKAEKILSFRTNAVSSAILTVYYAATDPQVIDRLVKNRKTLSH